jgi:hypothetical protein
MTSLIVLTNPNPKMNKTKYFEEHYGGTWKYDGCTSWWCDDGKRHVSRTASCMCDDVCPHPPRYILQDENGYCAEVSWC